MEQPPPDRVSWGGICWYLNGGYYMSRNGRLLHRAVYRAHYGEIPEGYDVHHKDEDKTNWAPENLEALPRSEHLKRHRSRGAVVASKPERQGRSWRQWGAIEPRDITCEGCGSVFRSRGMRAKYCHLNCRMRHYRRNGRVVEPKKPRRIRPPRPCAVCGKPFKPSYHRQPTCSSQCGWVYRRRQWAERRPSKLCPICQESFWSDRLSRQTFRSRRCQGIHCSRRNAERRKDREAAR